METPVSPADNSKPSFDVTRKFVRVTGERNGFIEFDFAVGEPGLSVEMMLSPEAFDEFCRVNEVEVLPPGDETDEADEAGANQARDEEAEAWNWRLADATGRSGKKV